jgi:hypothetical protein
VRRLVVAVGRNATGIFTHQQCMVGVPAEATYSKWRAVTCRHVMKAKQETALYTHGRSGLAAQKRGRDSGTAALQNSP